VLARLNARGAIQAATTALEAQLLLAEAERKNKYLPDHKRLMERRAAALEKKIEVEERRYAQLISEGITKLSEAQKAQLEEARTTLDKGRRDRDLACGEAEKFKRLFALPGGGGVSKNQVDEKVSACATGRAGYRLAEAKLGELDFVLSEAYRKANLEADDSAQRLLQFRVEYDAALQEIALEENKVKLALQSARLAADAADRVKFDNIDEDNFLQILAPVSGIITNVAVTQPGDKVQSNAPVVGIAPEGAQAVLQIEIPEKDRGFLKAGLAVKMKFSAFPYQRYGFVDGTLEYVSPATKLSTDTKAPPVYKGRVSLEKDYVATENGRQLLRYGMAASAEIVVRKRRLIDIALDPFRKVRG
jgi:HlyD family secretion protein